MDSSAVVIVAAGQGRRLGLGPKALVTLDGETLLSRVHEQARDVGLTRIIAVLPPGVSCPIKGLLSVPNPEGASGPLGSVVAALDVLDSGDTITDLAVWPVDHPWVSGAQLDDLRRAAQTAGADVARVVPRWQGRRGHPIWVRTPGLTRLRSIDSVLDGTLREHLVAAGPVLEIDARDGSVLRNLNAPEDL